MKLIFPKWGGGGVVTLLDKDGKEVYNSGFVQNDLTDAGVMWIVGKHFGGYSNYPSPTSNSNNIIFQRDRKMSLATNVASRLIVHDSNKDEEWEVSASPTSVGSEGNYSSGYSSNPLIIDDKIYIMSRTRGTFPMGEVVGNLTSMSLKLANTIVSRIDFDDAIEVKPINQLIVTYFRVAEVSEYFEIPSGPNRNMTRKILPPHDLGDGALAYYNPLYAVHGYAGNTNDINRDFNYISVCGFGGNFSTNRVNDWTGFYENGVLVQTLKFTSSTAYKLFMAHTNNNSELSRTTTVTIEIPPATNLPPFDRIVFGGAGAQHDTQNKTQSPQRSLTIDFPEPIIKTNQDRLDLTFEITLKGGKDSLDLTDVLPHIIES